jgi:ABC-type multidrug transport system ATPase subunit
MNIHSIDIQNLGKSYGKIEALKNISFQVEKAELFGLIGPDGAGKTSIMRILTSLLKPTTGSASVEGFDVVKDYKSIRKIVGYMPGRFSLYYDLTVEENLNFFATIFGTTIQENYDLIKDIYMQIEPFKNRKAGKLSGGMKQKLALSCALIHKPEVLILDEPTTGVDAVSRKEFWEMLKKLKANNITIIVSTPYMDEASLCDKIALIQKGEILSIDKPQNISASYTKPLYSVRSNDMYKLGKDLNVMNNVHSAFRFGDNIHVATPQNIDSEKIHKKLQELGHKEIVLQKIEPNIEDCFMDLTKDIDG